MIAMIVYESKLAKYPYHASEVDNREICITIALFAATIVLHYYLLSSEARIERVIATREELQVLWRSR